MYLLFDFGGISSHWIWLSLTILFAIIEAATLGLTTIWFALAGVIVTFLSFLPIPFEFQVLIFLAISGVFLFFTRPLAIKKFKTGRVKTNVDSLVGKHVLVTKQISEFDSGEVKLNSQIWSARLEDDSSVTLTKGTKCEVVKIEGVQVVVRAVD